MSPGTKLRIQGRQDTPALGLLFLEWPHPSPQDQRGMGQNLVREPQKVRVLWAKLPLSDRRIFSVPVLEVPGLTFIKAGGISLLSRCPSGKRSAPFSSPILTVAFQPLKIWSLLPL